MPLIYSGKTKEVFSTDDSSQIRIRYRDTVLGANGIIDPGANQVLMEIPGKGELTCSAAVRFFADCAAAELTTHFVRRESPTEIIVKKAVRFPLEIVVRNFACGSYLRRHPAATSLAPLGGIVECFLKDDAAGDPLIDFEAAVAAGHLPAAHINEITTIAAEVNTLLKKRFDVVDFKVEFGLIAGTLTIIDEISADSIRIKKDKRLLTYEETLRRLA